MSRLEAVFHNVANLLVGVTGLIYAWMLYFVTPTDEFSIYNHPWQGVTHDLHLVGAPLLILAVGMIWQGHAGTRLRNGAVKRRRSGLSMLLTFLPMMFSGYFLQITVDETWRSIWLWLHLATSALWLFAYLIHWFSKLVDKKAT